MKAISLLKRSAIFAAAALICGGCVFSGEGSRELVFRPQSRAIEYTYDYDVAYAAPSADGGYDLVLTSGFDLRSSSYQQRLYPISSLPTAQVLHIHVAWRPARGSKSDYPAATNSSVHWHVFRGGRTNPTGHLTYGGVGFVAMELDKEESLFDLRDVTVRPLEAAGDVSDPLGPASVKGLIRAENNAPAVRAILARLEEGQDQSATQPATAQSSGRASGGAPAGGVNP